jgi:DNA polymerase I-like protein with 3'-5' exonuclease and polymerase domains
VAHPYPYHIIEHLRSLEEYDGVALEPFRNAAGVRGIAIATQDRYYFVPKDENWDDFLRDLWAIRAQLSIINIRRMVDLIPRDRLVYDMRLVHQDNVGFVQLMKNVCPGSPEHKTLEELEQKMAAHIRAAKTVHIDPNSRPLTDFMPVEFIEDWIRARVRAILHLWQLQMFMSDAKFKVYEQAYPLIRALNDIEVAGIRIDVDFVDRELTPSMTRNHSPAIMNALRSMRGLYRNGFVTTLLNPFGVKTGRLRVEGGFNCMGIPHGIPRQAIISRFEGGSIYTFDYNAIDYRCMVAAVGGEVAKLYEGSPDFHATTMRFLFPNPSEHDEVRRDIIKKISYVYIYGGQEETLVRSTRLPLEKVKYILAELDKHIGPIQKFRESLWLEIQLKKWITLPHGGHVNEGEASHPGQLLGLYAQSYSSKVFNDAVIAVNRFLQTPGTQSRIIFTVHDEIVVDVHPDEESWVPERIRQLMTPSADFVVKIKKGRTYGEAQ